MKKEIDLNNYLHKKEAALVGRDNGEFLLKELQGKGFNFEALENAHEIIQIIIPERIITVNKSFFLGLFETTVQRLGRDGFYKKYEFTTTEHINKKIKDHVEAALLKSDQKDILNG